MQDIAKDSPSAFGQEPPAAWPRLVELGLTAISVAEDAGGSGGTFLDEVVLCEQAALRGLDLPLPTNLVASWVLGHGDQAVTPVTRGLIVDDGFDDGRLVVPWGRWLDEVVLIAADGTVSVAREVNVVTTGEDLAGGPVDTVALGGVVEVGRWAGQRTTARARAGILWSAQVLGAARGVHALARAHVMTREQFGKPLVRIPAVAASVAHMRTGLIQLESVVERAALLAERDAAGGFLEAAAICRTIADEVATDVAARGHQLHGAMGITEEYGLGAYTRRLWSWRDADGGARRWSELVGRAAREGGESAVWDAFTA
ncbi:acyl-CoA dehydrogenase family protein [Actinomadura rugatobispora]|uniref:Acyl-CoA dehydrogenase family protein n=1 Tax=Actinomadura rugatobispora TaxID=1994 RepID=A0ABW0ZPX7_9ACTN